ncbi:MAG: RNA-splicing ligase RtcB [Holosporales bacterium]
MNTTKENQSFHIVSTHKSWIESEAVEQLKKTGLLKGMQRVVGLPDLHVGKTAPVGASYLSKNIVYPHLVGNDIGCGMAFFETELPSFQVKLDKWVKKLDGLEEAYDGNVEELLADHGVQSRDFNHLLGTIGGGNHFSELQSIFEIHDQKAFDALKLNSKRIYLTVHSGSRGYGQKILDDIENEYGISGLEDEKIKHYLSLHNDAIAFASANRALIAKRITQKLRTDMMPILDIHHNFVEEKIIDHEYFYLHRKGATPSDKGPIIIPGSRGDLSYLVLPTDNQENSLFSLAHGAGRKWKRSDAKGKMQKYKAQDLTRTSFGSYVICEDKNLIFEEAPQAYKNIETVISDLKEHNLIQVVATLKPIITYKTRRRD